LQHSKDAGCPVHHNAIRQRVTELAGSRAGDGSEGREHGLHLDFQKDVSILERWNIRNGDKKYGKVVMKKEKHPIWDLSVGEFFQSWNFHGKNDDRP